VPDTGRRRHIFDWLHGRPRAITALALAIACVIPALWPGDIPFINDEPQLITSAVSANHAHQLAKVGLLGTYGFAYGPAPTWVYQLLMAVSHDLVLVAVLHALLMSVTTGVALWWLSRSLGLWVWFAPLPLLSPYFWFYSRVLWDNPFVIPLGALALAGYAAHNQSGSSAGLRVSVAALVLLPLVHLMSLALVAPLAAHMIVIRGRSLWTHKVSLTAIIAAVCVLAWPYCTYLVTAHGPESGRRIVVRGVLFPLAGGRLFSASGLEYFYGAHPVSGQLFGAAETASLVAYPLVWLGIIVALLAVRRAVQTRTWTPRTHVAGIAVAAVACQMVIDGISGKFEHPHYENGTWIAFVVLMWLAVDALAERPLWRRVAMATTAQLASANLLAVGLLLVRLHGSGTREGYGPTLANQQAIGQQLAGYAPESEVQCDVIMWNRFPHALATIRELTPSRYGVLPVRPVLLRYASDNSESGLVELVER